MITIKTTEEHEAELLSDIQKQSFLPLYEKYHDRSNPCLRGKEDILGRLSTPVFRYFTILENAHIIGGIFFRCSGSGIFFAHLGKGEYYLQRVFIAPSSQGKGAASAAILLCEKEFGDAVKLSVDFPVDLLKNRRCYEKAGYRDSGKRFSAEEGLILACFEKKICTQKDQVRPIIYDILPETLAVIHAGFATVAAEFNLTRENCPKHTNFIPIEYLQTQMQWGWYMFGLFEDEKLIGYASLSDDGSGAYEMHNLTVLPQCRHKGHGKTLLDHAKEKVLALGGTKIKIGIIEENQILKTWYVKNGFVHTGTKKFNHLPFTAGYMEWNDIST